MTIVTKTDVVPVNQIQNAKMPLPKKYIDHPDYTEYVYETSASTGKKVGVGVASAFITGLGQCINGDWGKGIGMFLGGIACGILSMKVPRPFGILVGILGSFGLSIYSIVDAVKNAKSETVQIVPKGNGSSQNINYSA